MENTQKKGFDNVPKHLYYLYSDDSTDDKPSIDEFSIGSIDGLDKYREYREYSKFRLLSQKDKILFLLYDKELSGVKIAQELEVTKGAISQHTISLENEGKIEKTNIGFKITALGLEYLDSFIKEKSRKENELIKRKAEEQKKKEDLKDSILKIEEFFDLNEKLFNDKKNILSINFFELSKFDTSMADLLLDDPDKLIPFFESAAEIKFEKLYQKNQKIKVRIYNLPKSQTKSIADLRVTDLGKFFRIKCNVLSATDVKPKTTSSKFECFSCGNVLTLLQEEDLFKEPSMCSCGRKGRFKLLSKEMIDSQRLEVEELPEDLHQRSNPKKIHAVLTNDLTNIENQPFFENGLPITLNCIVREQSIFLKKGGHSTTFNLYLDVNSIEVEQIINNLNFSTEEIASFKKYSENAIENLKKDFAPDIFDRDNEKTGIVASIVSGGDPLIKGRDDSNLFIVGDPGQAKSALLLEAHKITTGSRWISGKGASGVGLIGSTTKDKLFGDVILQKGALPMANQNVCFCDELDKMRSEDRDALHEALENQSVSIDKWNKHATFKTDCTFIAVANPKESRFHKDDLKYKQIDLPKSLLERFDLIFAVEDRIDKTDVAFAKKILDSKLIPIKNNAAKKDSDFLCKYLYYVRKNYKPEIEEEVKTQIGAYWLEKRTETKENVFFKISNRHLEGLMRLTRAFAKLRCSNIAEEKDFKQAQKLFDYMLDSLEINGNK